LRGVLIKTLKSFPKTTTQRYVTIWNIAAFKQGEMENECTSHNVILFAIFVPEIIKVGGNLTKF